jgi:hypothetical protein
MRRVGVHLRSGHACVERRAHIGFKWVDKNKFAFSGFK